MVTKVVSKIPMRFFGTVPRPLKNTQLFKSQSTTRLRVEKLGLDSLQYVANSELFKRLEPILLKDELSIMASGIVNVAKVVSRPVINHFCKSTLKDIEHLNSQVASDIVATNLSEHIHSTKQGEENKETLMQDLESSIQYFAVKPSAVCRQSVLEGANLSHPEQVDMRMYYSQLIRMAEKKGKTIVLDAEGRQIKSAYDELVHNILSQKLSPIFTIQASYRDALETLHHYHEWAKDYDVNLEFKLVKGAYVGHDQTNSETASMTCQTFDETHTQYLKLIEASLNLGHRPIIASHNDEILDIAEKESLATGNLLGLEVRHSTLTVAPYGDFNDAFHWTLRRMDSGVDGTRKRSNAIKKEIANR